MGGGGKGGGSSTYVSGYRYHMGVQIAVCHGPVDSVNRIIIGERDAWVGAVTDNATIYIDKPELFGGDSREGGVKGHVDVMMGAANQPRNGYLAANQSPTCSAYRGLLSLVFRQFMWASGNPYFKSPWVEFTRILKGWQGNTPWNPSNAVINTYDMNAAHIIYQCLTDNAWGMGYNTADMDEGSFLIAAMQLKNEEFGLSLEWDTQSSIEDFVQKILDHVNGTLGLNLATGKFRLRLIRDDYVVGDLLVLDESNIVEVKSFQRAAYGDSANEVVVTYTDRDQKDATVAVQDIASISAQGAVISVSRSYPGIRTSSLAARVALRDLKTLSAPLAKVVIVTNRIMWDKEKGDVIRLNWPSLGIAGLICRVIDIDKGSLVNGQITVTVVEDVFGLPVSSYTAPPQTQWVDTVVPPIAVDASRAIESPYWEVVRNMSLANQSNLQPDYGFGLFMASRGSVRSTLNYILSASPDNVTYSDVATGHFNPVGTLVAILTPTAGTLTLTDAFDLDSVVLESDGGYAYIGNECVAVVSADPSTGVVVIKRGILDTVPAWHAAGVKMFFMTKSTAYDNTERVEGETVYYKPRPSTGVGTLDLDDADVETLVLSNRASRPYPPGNLQIDGQSYPITITGPDVQVTWAHRDRLAQTVSFNDYLTGNIGPEPGVTYRLRVYSGATLKRTYDIDGTSTSWAYPNLDDTADGNLSTIRITLHSVRDGLESLYGHDHSFQRSIVTGSVAIDSPPLAPVLSASNSNFAIYVTWLFGDARTNIEHVELRVSEDPDFAHSVPLQNVLYPTPDYLHELGTANTFRWYWARVADTNAMLSPWSNMVSGRALASTSSPTDMLAGINALLSAPAGTDSLEIISDRFSIVAPDGLKTPFAVVDTGGGVYKTLLNSDVLIGGNVDIANLTTGSLPSDVMLRLGGGAIELDGAGEIRVFKDLSPTADFVRLSAGEIRFLRYISGAYQSYNYLSRLETGIANSGDTVAIPGYWKAQPRVMVSPAILALYKKDYVNQDQAIACEAKNIRETVTGSGQWLFDATATLNLAAASGGGALNLTSGVISANTYTTATQTTPANCTSITPSLTLTSVRGNGTSQYYRRTVRWRVEYWNGSSWVLGSWNNVAMGDQLLGVTAAIAFTFPSSGVWQWRIGYESYDTNGTVFGAMSYTYSQTTVTATTATYTTNYPTTGSNGNRIATLLNYGTATGSGEIYQTVYSWSALFTALAPASLTIGYWQADPNGVTESAPLTYNGNGTYPATKTVSGNKTITGAGYVASFASQFYVSWDPNQTLQLSGSAIIYRRTPIPNSTTPANTFALSSYTYALTTAQVLATGSINWMAVGE